MKKRAQMIPNQRLRRERELRGWSQKQLGDAIGTNKIAVSRWEGGITTPSPYFRQRLCELFGRTAAELGFIAEADNPGAPPALLSLDQQTATAPDVGAALLDAAIPTSLAVASGLIGRDALLHQLKEQLFAGKSVALSALNGIPGVGKTTLAVALAHDPAVQQHFHAGVLWAAVGPQPNLLELLSRWGALLGIASLELARQSSAEAWAQALHAVIGPRPMLLVLDDIWQWETAVALRVGGPHCAHLVTTRFPTIAWQFAEEGATVVRELDEVEGLLLLKRLAPELVTAEPLEAQALVQAAGGLPLALTLLGNHLRVQGHSGQPRRVRRALEQLREADARLQLGEPQPLAARHPSLPTGALLSLQTTIAVSEQQLSPAAQAALRAFSVFPPKPNTFTEEAALAIGNVSEAELDALMDAGLLESSGPGRYSLHQTISDYARAHLVETSPYERLAVYFAGYVAAHTSDYEALERETNNVLAALEAAEELGMQVALIQGATAFASFLEIRGLYAVAQKHLKRALLAAQALEDIVGQATALYHLGQFAMRQGIYERAQEHLEAGLTLTRPIHHWRLEAQLLGGLGDLMERQGQLAGALPLLTEGLALFEKVGDQQGVAQTLRMLGNIANEQGRWTEARQFYVKTLGISRQSGDPWGEAAALNNLGDLSYEQGQRTEASQFYKEALAIFQQVGDRWGTACVLYNLGELAHEQQRLSEARRLHEEALAIFRLVGSQAAIAQALRELSIQAREQEQFAEAHQLLTESLETLRLVGNRRSEALTLRELGSLSRMQGQLAEAQTFLTTALATLRQVGDQRNTALTLRELGILAGVQGQAEQACQLLTEALEILRQVGNQREIALTLRELGILAEE